MSSGTIYIGIDPGANTGFAVWNRVRSGQYFSQIECTDFWGAIDKLEEFHLMLCPQHDLKLVVVIEASNLNRSMHASTMDKIAGTPSEKLRRILKMAQDVGGVKRECELLMKWCERNGITFIAAQPTAKSYTKLKADRFTQLTGWKARTNEHSRDAAMLVWGK
jgi:hypothetical protein